MEHLQKEIRLMLATIRTFVSKLPQAKQQKASLSLQKTVQSYHNKLEVEHMKQLINELNYQMNFLKLTNPNIQMIKPSQQEELQQEEGVLETKDGLQEGDEKIEGSGTYILKDGKLVKGEAEQRKQVDYSNWYAGNVDPEELRMHKELLDRQHFGGPFWQGKPKPKSVLDVESPYTVGLGGDQPVAETNPNLLKKKDPIFEQVKR